MSGRNLSRAAMGRAGAENFPKRAPHTGELPADTLAEIGAVLADLGSACGPTGPSVQQRVLLSGIEGLLLAQWRLKASIRYGNRGSQKARAELVILNNCIRRQLKALELPPKPKPRTLADLMVQRNPQKVQSGAPNCTFPLQNPNEKES